MPGRMPQQIAVVFALCAFSVSLTVALVHPVSAITALIRCLVVLVCAYPIGRVLGAALAVALNEHLTSIVAASPVQDAVRLRPDGADEIGGVDVIEDVERL